MPNKLLGEIELEIGGVAHTLRPSFEALLEMEDRAGCGVLRIAKAFFEQDIKFKYVVAVLYGGIKGANPAFDMSFSKFGQMLMDEGNMPKFAAAAATLLSKGLVGREKKIEESPASESQ